MTDYGWGPCPKCKQVSFMVGHKCPPSYLVRPEDYEPEDAVTVYGESVERAAENYLDERFADFDYPSGLAVIVENPRSGEQYEVYVSVEAVPSFTGTIRKITKKAEAE